MTCARFIVIGKVQGVFFRASTRERALRLGLTGHAKNFADVNVYVVAWGCRDAFDEVVGWVHHGPPAASVENVR
ncbi:MAG: acylphosphatase, partial [Rhodanobacteraceae bacterium]